MGNDTRVPRSIRVAEDIWEHQASNPMISSFPDWIDERYRQEFMPKEVKQKKLEELRAQIAQLEKEIAEEDNEVKDVKALKIFKPLEISWISEVGRKRWAAAKEGKCTEEGVYKYFINHFNRPDITRRQFRVIMEDYL